MTWPVIPGGESEVRSGQAWGSTATQSPPARSHSAPEPLRPLLSLCHVLRPLAQEQPTTPQCRRHSAPSPASWPGCQCFM